MGCARCVWVYVHVCGEGGGQRSGYGAWCGPFAFVRTLRRRPPGLWRSARRRRAFRTLRGTRAGAGGAVVAGGGCAAGLLYFVWRQRCRTLQEGSAPRDFICVSPFVKEGFLRRLLRRFPLDAATRGTSRPTGVCGVVVELKALGLTKQNRDLPHLQNKT